VITWPTVMVTGHRPQHLRPDARLWVRAELDRLACKLRDEHGTTVGISGMAIGADLWWADSVVKAGLDLHAHVPFPQQPSRWPDESKAEWDRLLGLATHTVTYGAHYDVGLLHARNRGMVNASGQVLAVWVSGQGGGTRAAIEYAVRQGLRPTWLDPETHRTWWPSVETWQAMLTSRARRRLAA
jgi:hypothetical protein